jgi:hypothetical protein
MNIHKTQQQAITLLAKMGFFPELLKLTSLIYNQQYHLWGYTCGYDASQGASMKVVNGAGYGNMAGRSPARKLLIQINILLVQF